MNKSSAREQRTFNDLRTGLGVLWGESLTSIALMEPEREWKLRGRDGDFGRQRGKERLRTSVISTIQRWQSPGKQSRCFPRKGKVGR
jgi:hypothetical protein